MNIRDLEEELFDEWSAGRADFVRDGVIVEKAYKESKLKLLFVLKEVNDPGGGGWDLREFVRGGGRAQTWNNITRWAEGIRNLEDDQGWSSLESIDESRRMEALASIAVMNLKKSPGGHTTDSAKLAEAAGLDRSLIARQFRLYHPDLVICCGSETSDLFYSSVHGDDPPKWERTSRGVWYFKLPDGPAVIGYSHPEARCADFLLHYGIVDAVRELSA